MLANPSNVLWILGRRRDAERPRAMLPGGLGIAPRILAYLSRPNTIAFSPASRVSISELLADPQLARGDLEPTRHAAQADLGHSGHILDTQGVQPEACGLPALFGRS